MGLGSEIRDPEKNLFLIPDPGVKKAPNPGSATLIFTSHFTLSVNLFFLRRGFSGQAAPCICAGQISAAELLSLFHVSDCPVVVQGWVVRQESNLGMPYSKK